jgi:ectoine hydroxylase
MRPVVFDCKGPLYLVPGSQKDGIQDHSELTGRPEGYEQSPDWISNLTAKLKYVVERDRVAELVKSHGLTAAKGPAGSVLVFHSNIVHASPPNITPLERSTLLFSYNHISNAPPESRRRRPDFLSSADTHPIQEVDEELGHLLSCAVARPLGRGNHEHH